MTYPTKGACVSITTVTELWRMSATELAEAIRSGQASSREVVEAHLRRIEQVNPAVNAIPAVLAEQALEAAQETDRAVAGGGDLPPLHGVPFTVMGNIDLAGTPITHRIKALATAYPAIDAPAVERMRAAGAIPIGQTNLPDFAIGWHTDSELWGATVNPWARSGTPGASSGGDAAALATGMTPVGLGNYTLGSLRWPAQCCGVTTLKPTLGRIPHATTAGPVDMPISNQLLGVNGPLARRVADLRAAFAATAGPTWRDPWTVPGPRRGPARPSPIRVARVTDPPGHGTAKQVRDGVRKPAEALADARYAVEEAEPPSVALAAKTCLDIFIVPVRAMWPATDTMFRARTRQFVSALLAVAGEHDPAAVIQSFMTRQSLQRARGEFQQTHPLILAPACTGLPFAVGADLTTPEVAGIIATMPMVLAVSLLGLPAVALPVGIAAGLPQSVQVIGPRYREDLCLDAAAAIENRVGILTPIDPR
jgi:amidase